MARPPTELQRLIESPRPRSLYRKPRGIYRVLKVNECLTAEARRHRREIIRGLRQAFSRPPTGWTFDRNGPGARHGRLVPHLGGRTLYDELLEVLEPYLNEMGEALAYTTATELEVRRGRKWWWPFSQATGERSLCQK